MAAHKAITTFTLLGAVALSGPALAFRCGNSLVSEGDQEFEVNQRCGSPVNSEWIVADPWGVVKQAVYDAGAGKFYRIVLFRDGKIVSITNGPRH